MKIEDVAARASGYGIPGKVVDGNDVFAVYGAAETAISRARRGEGPTLLECKTYRRGGHSRTDACRYRPKEEATTWFAKDPIPRARKELMRLGVLTTKRAKKIEEKVRAEIDDAIEYARNSPSPKPEDTLTGVFAGGEE